MVFKEKLKFNKRSMFAIQFVLIVFLSLFIFSNEVFVFFKDILNEFQLIKGHEKYFLHSFSCISLIFDTSTMFGLFLLFINLMSGVILFFVFFILEKALTVLFEKLEIILQKIKSTKITLKNPIYLVNEKFLC